MLAPHLFFIPRHPATQMTSRGVSKNQNLRESPKSSKNLAKSNKSDTNCKLVFILRKNTTIVVIFSEVNTFKHYIQNVYINRDF